MDQDLHRNSESQDLETSHRPGLSALPFLLSLPFLGVVLEDEDLLGVWSVGEKYLFVFFDGSLDILWKVVSNFIFKYSCNRS